MIKQLPIWYKPASLMSVNPSILELRSKTIKTIVESKTIEWLFNCVRLFLDLEVDNQEFESELVELFLNDDPLFQQSDNKLELRILAGAIVYEAIIYCKNEGYIELALGSISGSFANEKMINPDIIGSIYECINKLSVDLREQNIVLDLIEIDESEDPDEDIAIDITSDNTYRIPQVNEYITQLNNRITILSEESNIHWWIFRGYSNCKNLPIRDLDIEILPIVLGKDLSDLMNIIPGSVASEQFLRKLIFDSFHDKGNNQFTIKDIVNAIDKTDKQKFVERFNKTRIGNLCPLMFAFQKALEIDDNKTWIGYFEKYTKIKASKKFSIIEFAKQYYTECLLVKLL